MLDITQSLFEFTKARVLHNYTAKDGLGIPGIAFLWLRDDSVGAVVPLSSDGEVADKDTFAQTIKKVCLELPVLAVTVVLCCTVTVLEPEDVTPTLFEEIVAGKAPRPAAGVCKECIAILLEGRDGTVLWLADVKLDGTPLEFVEIMESTNTVHGNFTNLLACHQRQVS